MADGNPRPIPRPSHPAFEEAQLAHERVKILSELLHMIGTNPQRFGNPNVDDGTNAIVAELSSQMNGAITQEKHFAHLWFLSCIGDSDGVS